MSNNTTLNLDLANYTKIVTGTGANPRSLELTFTQAEIINSLPPQSPINSYTISAIWISGRRYTTVSDWTRAWAQAYVTNRQAGIEVKTAGTRPSTVSAKNITLGSGASLSASIPAVSVVDSRSSAVRTVQDGERVVLISGPQGLTGPPGAPGTLGADGRNGVGIQNITVDAGGNLLVELDNGTIVDAGTVNLSLSIGSITQGNPVSASITGAGLSAELNLVLPNATALGLGNVTDESKATMFSNPTFTGTVSGVTAAHVGLGNVTNESKVTMFASPTFTGTVAGVTATMVGLGNVTNESKATMFTSPTFTGLLTAQQSTEVYAVKPGTGGTGDYDFSTASIWLVNVNSVGQFALNFTNVPTTVNRTTVVTLILQQGTTPYGPSSLSIAGAAQSIRWTNGGVYPTFGSNRYEILSFTLIRLADASWAVLGSLSSYS